MSERIVTRFVGNRTDAWMKRMLEAVNHQTTAVGIRKSTHPK